MRPYSVLRFFPVLTFLIFAIGTQVVMAGTTGKIVGTVLDDETGEPLPGVNVLLSGTARGAATDLEGYYFILNIPPGTYSLKASMIGYTEMLINKITVATDYTSTVDFRLQSTVLEGEGVTIIAQRPLVVKDQTSAVAVITAEQIQAMPVDEFSEVLELQAGLVKDSAGKLHIRGGRASEIGYLVDGISVTDPYSGDIAIEVENAGIQELTVISGTYNAEYGQAMSGIVNIVTKDGGDKLTGNISFYSGDYASSNSDVFLGIDDVDANNIFNIQGGLSGPVPGFGDKLTFFASVRRFENDGWLNGVHRFNPQDWSCFSCTQWRGQTFFEVDTTIVEASGPGTTFALNPLEKTSLQGKITYRITPTLKLSYGIFWNQVDSRKYDHLFKLNPTGSLKDEKKGYTHIVTWNHTVSSRTFYTLKFSNFFSSFESFAFEDPNDPRYANPDRLRDASSNAFRTGGALGGHFARETDSLIGRFEVTSQVTKRHQIKTGFEVKRHELTLDEFVILPKTDDSGVLIDPFESFIPPLDSPLHNAYIHNPVEISAFVQDKMEFQNLVVNLGFRYDYFDADGEVPVDFLRPTTSPRRSASIKQQVSPRVGLAYPISDQGVVSISYGHFFQMPTFNQLYTNPDFEPRLTSLTRDDLGGLESLLAITGNADLEPQMTVGYEVALQQGFSDNIVVNITVYNRDIRNLLGTEFQRTIQGDEFTRFINRDFGNVTGVSITLDYLTARNLSFALDYTFQVAEGNASDPRSVFFDNRTDPPVESEKQRVPLDWDQRHTLNFVVSLEKPANWGASLIGKFGSGLPFTPEFEDQRSSFENSGRKPAQFTLDLKAHKDFKFGPFNTSIILTVFNLLDRKNEIDVFNDTGRAGTTLAARRAGAIFGVNTLDEFLNRPEFFSSPREIRLGASWRF